MTPEAQRIAIAEACGWRAEQWSKPNDSWFLYSPTGYRADDPSCGTREAAFMMHAPDYLSDLNAMAQAEKVLTPTQRDQYAAHIEAWTDPNTMRQICMNTGDPTGTCDYEVLFFYITATAAQRAEAFLRTIGKWERAASRGAQEPGKP